MWYKHNRIIIWLWLVQPYQSRTRATLRSSNCKSWHISFSRTGPATLRDAEATNSSLGFDCHMYFPHPARTKLLMFLIFSTHFFPVMLPRGQVVVGVVFCYHVAIDNLAVKGMTLGVRVELTQANLKKCNSICVPFC